MFQTPSGWKREQLSYNANCVVFHAPNKEGMVTVDFKNRVYRGGVTTLGAVDSDGVEYNGRGWKNRICADAVAWLHAVLEDGVATRASAKA